MNYLKVKLWGEELGRLVWDSSRKLTYFQFAPRPASGLRPDIAPLVCPPGNPLMDTLPIYGSDEPIYQGLPPFIADSLPDSWGNRLFDQWVKQNHIGRSELTPLYKLMFIGHRGMGALEFEPAAKELEHRHAVDISALYDLSLTIAEERDSRQILNEESLTMQSLLAVGTSAGGRQMKAIIAINPQTGEIRSGQTDALNGFDYHLIKFEDDRVPTSEIEMTFYDLATQCGIRMQPCFLMEVEGKKHFVTQRFDRKDGKKVHVQTLAAMNPEAKSYEDLMATCRALNLTEEELREVYRRLVFNVLANNTDDHNKNFSFLLEEGGKWRLAPAYDMTFIFNVDGSGAETRRRLSLGGKISGITKQDLMEFGRIQGIKSPQKILGEVESALQSFHRVALMHQIPSPWRQIIELWFNPDAKIRVNSRGYYEVMSQGRRLFVRPNMPQYAAISEMDFTNIDNEVLNRILTDLAE